MNKLYEQCQSYIDCLRFERRSSEHTVDSYKRVLEKALKALNSECPDIESWSQVGLEQMRIINREFNFNEKAERLKNRSVAHDLYVLSSFFKFLISQGLLNENPFKLIKAPKADKVLPRVLTASEVKALLDVEAFDDKQIRDTAISELLFSSGLRVSELTGLTLSDYDENSCEVRVMGKGGKERIIPVGSKARERLTEYLKIRDNFGPKSNALFLNRFGKAISSRSVENNLKAQSERAGLDTNVYPHKLRHSFATALLQGGADLRSVQEMLGHANLAATQVYTHLDFEHLKQVYIKSHPRSYLHPEKKTEN